MGKELLSPRQVRQHISILFLISRGSVAADVHCPARFTSDRSLTDVFIDISKLNYTLCGTTYRCLQLNVGK